VKEEVEPGRSDASRGGESWCSGGKRTRAYWSKFFDDIGVIKSGGITRTASEQTYRGQEGESHKGVDRKGENSDWQQGRRGNRRNSPLTREPQPSRRRRETTDRVQNQDTQPNLESYREKGTHGTRYEPCRQEMLKRERVYKIREGWLYGLQ